MGFNSKRFISTRYFSSTLFSTIPHKEVRVEEIKVGVDEKKKTQGMRRDLGHKGCGWVTNQKTNLLYTFPLSVVQQMLLVLLPHLPCKSYRTMYRSLEEL